MSLTKILIVTNQYSSSLSLSDTEGKGVNLTGSSKVQTNTSGNPGSMPVPWYYDGITKSDKDFSEHHLLVTTSDGKYTYYIWQNKQDIYYATKPPAKGVYTGTKLRGSVGGSVALFLKASGDLEMQTLDLGVTKAKDLVNFLPDISEYSDFISEIYKAGVTFVASSDGQNIINSMKSGITTTSFNGQDYVSQVLATSAFSKLNLFGADATKGDTQKNNNNIGATMTVGAGADLEIGAGVMSSIGCAQEMPKTSSSQIMGYASSFGTVGIEVGASASFQFGFWASKPSDLEGVGYAVVAAGEFIAGASVGVYFDSSSKLVGLTIGVGVGEEFQAAFAVGYTVVF